MKKILSLLLVMVFAFTARGQSVQDYIDQYAQKAQVLMSEHHIPASIILAVAIHESAAGKSKIARYLNNHFGFKGKNSNTEIKSSYRDFPSVDSCYNHFIAFLKGRNHFKHLFDKLDAYNFVGWAKGIQKGGYARNRAWASQVLTIIRKYNLQQYDNRPDDYEEPVPEPEPVIKTRRIYTVKKGDNLSLIAKKNGTSVKTLKKINNLKTDRLKIGQKLKL